MAVLWPALPFLVSLSAGLVILRLLPPRPDRERRSCLPGHVACVLAVTIGGLSYLTLLAAMTIRSGWGVLGPEDFARLNIFLLPIALQHGGWGATAGWLLLITGSRWRPEPSWIDRAGRVLGLVWVGVGVILADFWAAGLTSM
jgi:hypothetical protein